jgi:hypothetical protein
MTQLMTILLSVKWVIMVTLKDAKLIMHNFLKGGYTSTVGFQSNTNLNHI